MWNGSRAFYVGMSRNFGGPKWTVDGTIFELWLGPPAMRSSPSANNVAR